MISSLENLVIFEKNIKKKISSLEYLVYFEKKWTFKHFPFLSKLFLLKMSFKTEELSILSMKSSEEAKHQGNHHYKQGSYVTALKFYARALEFMDEGIPKEEIAIVYLNMSLCYSKLNDSKKALIHCNLSLEFNPSRSKAHHIKGLIHLSQAIEAFRKSLENGGEIKHEVLSQLTEILEVQKNINSKNVQSSSSKGKLSNDFDERMTDLMNSKRWEKTRMNGISIEGDFNLKTMDGFGVITDKIGNVYSGEFKQGMLEGTGRILYKNGAFENGFFKDGKLSGFGKRQRQALLSFWDGKNHFEEEEGEFQEGIFQGKGTKKYVNGYSVEGKFKNGEICEVIQVIDPMNKSFQAQIINPFLNGIHVGINAIGNIYDGEFENGNFNGKGKIIAVDGIQYDGDFKYGFLLKGKIVFPNGEINEGSFLRNKLNGKKCKKKLPNNYLVEGEFKQGLLWKISGLYDPKGNPYRNGSKIYKLKNIGDAGRPIRSIISKNTQINGFQTAIDDFGVIWEGKFINGLLNGKTKIIHVNGDFSEEFFKDGILKEFMNKNDILPNENIQDIQLMNDFFAKEVQLDKLKLISLPIQERNREFKAKTELSLHLVQRLKQEEKSPNWKKQILLGTTIVGNFDFETLNGFGIIVNILGVFFLGEFKGGLLHGLGCVDHTNGDYEEGVFNNGKINGKGLQIFQDKLLQNPENKEELEGEFRDSLLNGEGRRKYLNKYTIIGSFSLGALKRIDKATDSQGNKIELKILSKHLNGDVYQTIDEMGNVYDGFLKNGEFWGVGKFISAAGHIFEGEFERSELQKGKKIMMNGEIQEGLYKRGLLNSKGSRKLPNGYKIEGEFLNCDLIKVYNLYDPNGKKYRDGAKIYMMRNEGLEMRAESWDLNGFQTAVDEVGNIWEGEFKNGLLNGKVKTIWFVGKPSEGFFKNGMAINYLQI